MNEDLVLTMEQLEAQGLTTNNQENSKRYGKKYIYLIVASTNLVYFLQRKWRPPIIKGQTPKSRTDPGGTH